jgi:hypothetical protein
MEHGREIFLLTTVLIRIGDDFFTEVRSAK